MTRLVDVDVQELPPLIRLRIGDVLRFSASGGRTVSGGAVTTLGTYVQSLLAPDGSVLVPAGLPNVVLFLAEAVGGAELEILAGDGWHPPTSRRVSVEVSVG